MAIREINILTLKQDYQVLAADRAMYGEVYTPYTLIKQMLDLFPEAVYSDPNRKWLDPGAGSGFFSLYLFSRLDKGLIYIYPDKQTRHNHILHQMLFLNEIKPENICKLKALFGADANIHSGDFLAEAALNTTTITTITTTVFDYIIGNPPYNINGKKKIPTNKVLDKKADGNMCWFAFIKKAVSLLKPQTGQLAFIVPSIWLKPDRAGIHQFLTGFSLQQIRCFSSNETNKLFNGFAQTPTCFFRLTNRQREAGTGITLYDSTIDEYVEYGNASPFSSALPLFAPSLIIKLQPFILLAKSSIGACFVKTNMPPKNTELALEASAVNTHANITTCILNGLQPTLVFNYSAKPMRFSGVSKLVLAHKMYGFPYLDATGQFGISNRDNYVIWQKTLPQLAQIHAFLNTRLARYIYDAARYRMKYLEKFAFDFLPDITLLPDFPSAADISDAAVAAYFGLSPLDQAAINSRHKAYGFFGENP